MEKHKGRQIIISIALAAATFFLAFSISRSSATPPAPATSTETKPRLTAVSTTSPAATVRRLMKNGAAPTKIWSALDGCSTADLRSLLQSISQNDTTSKANRLMVLNRWIELDPAAATNSVAEQWAPSINLPSALGAWGSLDPITALDHLNGLELRSGFSAYSALIVSAQKLTDFDLDSFYARLPEDQKAEATRLNLADDQIEVLRTLISEQSSRSATNARFIDWLLEDITDQALTTHAASEIIAVYSEDSLKKLGHPPGNILAAYYREDASAALEWIFNHQNPFTVASLSESLATDLTYEAPNLAAEVLQTLPNSQNRTELIQDLAENWQTEDAAAYSTWYQSLAEGDRLAIDQRFDELANEQEDDAP